VTDELPHPLRRSMRLPPASPSCVEPPADPTIYTLSQLCTTAARIAAATTTSRIHRTSSRLVPSDLSLPSTRQ
jgi:hypothetical protein